MQPSSSPSFQVTRRKEPIEQSRFPWNLHKESSSSGKKLERVREESEPEGARRHENASRVLDILGLGGFPALHIRWKLRRRLQLRKCQPTLRRSVGSGELCVPTTAQCRWLDATGVAATSTPRVSYFARSTRSLWILVSNGTDARLISNNNEGVLISSILGVRCDYYLYRPHYAKSGSYRCICVIREVLGKLTVIINNCYAAWCEVNARAWMVFWLICRICFPWFVTGCPVIGGRSGGLVVILHEKNK